MSTVICPTVLAKDQHEFREQMERVLPFAERIQIDLCDGEFAPGKTLDPKHVWIEDGIDFDLHLMYRYPDELLKEIDRLNPHMVIVHAEADHAAVLNVIDYCEHLGIKTGLCVLPETSVKKHQDLLVQVDHCLIFGGHLGSFVGQADLEQLKKVDDIIDINPAIEIGWDGGANDSNVIELHDGGIEVINVGGFIQHSKNPKKAYSTLLEKLR